MTEETSNHYLKIIIEQINAGKIETATELYKKAITHFPNDLPLLLEYGRILHQSKTKQAAIEYYFELEKKYPTNSAINTKAFYIHLNSGDLNAAEVELKKATQKPGNTAATLLARIKLAFAKAQPQEAEKILHEAFNQIKELPDWCLKDLPKLALRAGSDDLAIGFLRELVKRTPNQADLHAQLVQLARKCDNTDLFLTHLMRLAELEPFDTQRHERIVQLCNEQGRTSELAGLLDRLIQKDPNSNWVLFRQTFYLEISPATIDVMVNWAKDTCQQNTGSPRQRLVAEKVLWQYTRQVNYNYPNPAQWETLCPPAESWQRPNNIEQVTSELAIARAPNSDRVALVFPGLGDLTTPPRLFLDRYFAALNCTAIYLRDDERWMGMRGLNTLAADLPQTLEYLRELVESCNGKRLISVGTSAGGPLAIHYGLALGAHRILAFSSPTNASPDFIARVNDHRGRAMTSRLLKLPAEMQDLRRLVEKYTTRPPIQLHYGAKHKLDRLHANYLAKLDGITCHPIAGHDTHASMIVLAQRGQLLPLLRQALLDTPSVDSAIRQSA